MQVTKDVHMQIILNIVFLWLLMGLISFMLLIMTLKGE